MDEDFEFEFVRFCKTTFLKKSVTLDELRHVLHLPSKEAATKLGISNNHLKRWSRKHGIMRWPSRTIICFKNVLPKLESRGDMASIQLARKITKQLDLIMETPTHKIDPNVLKDLSAMRVNRTTF